LNGKNAGEGIHGLIKGTLPVSLCGGYQKHALRVANATFSYFMTSSGLFQSEAGVFFSVFLLWE
jgi:hypothetical protein